MKGRATRLLWLPAACTAVAAFASACGSSDNDKSAAPVSSPAAKAVDIPYNGPEAGLPDSYGTLKKKVGFSFTIAYLQPLGGVPALENQAAGIKAAAARLGGRVIVKDNQLQPRLEVANFNQALAQRVDAIVIFPLDPRALGPSIAKAKRQGVKVVAIDTPPQADQQPLPGVDSNALTGRDLGAYSVVKQVAAKHPGSTFTVLGLAQPIPTLSYSAERLKYWAQKFGLKWVGGVDSQANTNQAYAQATANILTKYPDVQTIFTTTDIAALAAAGQRRVSGKPDVRIVGTIGEPQGLAAVKRGDIWVEWESADRAAAEGAVAAAYAMLTGQKVPKIAAMKGQLITGGQSE